MAGAARRGRRSGDGGSRKGGGILGSLRRHPFRIAGMILLVIVLWFLFSLFQPFKGDGSGKVSVTIPKGSSVSEVGDLLSKKGVIDSSTFFQIRVTLEGKRSDLYAGHFTLAHDMSYGAAIDALSVPPVKRVTTVTIPEGYSRSQAAQLVEEDGVPGSYTKKTVKSKYLDPAEYGGKKAKNLEGFLFPDTFELKPKAPVGDLVQLQLKDFKKRIKGVDMKYAKSKNLTVYDVLTIASMVEREAGVAKQRGDVASVIYNRLHEGMPLGIDATTRFATGNYSKPLTESQLAIDSPYNTRTNVGPAAWADQQPRPGGDQSGGAPGQDAVPLLRQQAEHLRRARLLQDRSRMGSRRRRLRQGARRKRRQRAEQLLMPGGGGMPRLAVIGFPVGHSRSPAMQSAALAELGLGEKWSYGAVEVAPEGFEAKVRELAAAGEYAGANVTVPHKEAALAVADEASEAARAIGAANTLSFAAGRIAADNTDAGGLLAALPTTPLDARALVLGAGGAARAVIWALVGEGARVEVWNRTAARAEELCAAARRQAGRRSRAGPSTT